MIFPPVGSEFIVLVPCEAQSRRDEMFIDLWAEDIAPAPEERNVLTDV
jgi:hypothetical protein